MLNAQSERAALSVDRLGLGAVWFGWANLIAIMAIVGVGVHRATRAVD